MRRWTENVPSLTANGSSADPLSAGSVWRGHSSHLKLLLSTLSGHAQDLRCTGTRKIPALKIRRLQPIGWCLANCSPLPVFFSIEEWTKRGDTPDVKTAEGVRQTGKKRRALTGKARGSFGLTACPDILIVFNWLFYSNKCFPGRFL